MTSDEQLNAVLAFLESAREHASELNVKVGDFEIHALLRHPGDSGVSPDEKKLTPQALLDKALFAEGDEPPNLLMWSATEPDR